MWFDIRATSLFVLFCFIILRTICSVYASYVPCTTVAVLVAILVRSSAFNKLKWIEFIVENRDFLVLVFSLYVCI